MNLDEALDLVRVPPGTDAKEIRRAYLRRIRDFRPESDPEGFQRLRAAYELAEALAGRGIQVVPASASPGPAAGGAKPAGEEPGGEDFYREEPVWDDLGGDEPDDDEWEMEGGVPLFHLGPAWEMLEEAEELLAAGKMKEGLDGTRRALRQAAEEYPESPFPTILVIQILLQLHLLDAPFAARRLTDEVRQLAQELGGEAALVRGEQNLTAWALLRDLNQLPGEFPAEVRTAILRSLKEGRPSLAVDAAQSYQRAHRSAARRAAELLETSQLNTLAAAYGPLLRGTATARPRQGNFALRTAAAILLWAAVHVGILLIKTEPSERASAAAGRELLALEVVPASTLGDGPRHGWEPGGELPQFTPTPEPERIRRDLEVLAEDECGPGSRRPSVGGGTYCELTRTFLRQLDQGNCTAAERTLHRFPYSLTLVEKRKKGLTTLTMKQEFGPYFAHRCLSYFLQRSGGFGTPIR